MCVFLYWCFDIFPVYCTQIVRIGYDFCYMCICHQCKYIGARIYMYPHANVLVYGPCLCRVA